MNNNLDGQNPLEKIKQSTSITFLKNCNENMEAELLISILETAGIPAATKYPDSGSYLNIVHGRNFQGIDVYVQSEDWLVAKEIVEDFTYERKKDKNLHKKLILRRVFALLLISIMLFQISLVFIINMM